MELIICEQLSSSFFMIKVSQQEILWRPAFTELCKILENTIFQNIWQE